MDILELKNFLKKHNLWAKKGLSQNFLVDKIALEKIVNSAELKPGDLVVEIGPGLGVLTQELVKKAGEIIAIEKDEKLVKLLNCSIVELLRSSSNIVIQQYSNDKVHIINADILNINLNEIIGDRKYKVVANIPYAITSKILELFLSRENKPELMVLLVQKEVAERICARPGGMSTLSVSVQLYGEPEIVDIVPKESFFPSPKVDSAILKIRIMNHAMPAGRQESRIMGKEEESKLFRCVHVGFSSRRKTLLNNLSNGYQLDRKKVSDILKEVGLNDNSRAQELSIEEWKKMAEKMPQNC